MESDACEEGCGGTGTCFGGHDEASSVGVAAGQADTGQAQDDQGGAD